MFGFVKCCLFEAGALAPVRTNGMSDAQYQSAVHSHTKFLRRKDSQFLLNFAPLLADLKAGAARIEQAKIQNYKRLIERLSDSHQKQRGELDELQKKQTDDVTNLLECAKAHSEPTARALLNELEDRQLQVMNDLISQQNKQQKSVYSNYIERVVNPLNLVSVVTNSRNSPIDSLAQYFKVAAIIGYFPQFIPQQQQQQQQQQTTITTTAAAPATATAAIDTTEAAFSVTDRRAAARCERAADRRRNGGCYVDNAALTISSRVHLCGFAFNDRLVILILILIDIILVLIFVSILAIVIVMVIVVVIVVIIIVAADCRVSFSV